MAKSSAKTDKILSQLDDLLSKAKNDITSAATDKDLEAKRVKFSGRKSQLTRILRNLKTLKPEEKRVVGSRSNETKIKIEELLENQRQKLISERLDGLALKEEIDITLPGKDLASGHKHPVTAMLHRSEDIFQKMGFDIVYPFEVDTDYNNFQAVNIPEGHPARDSWDTFWTEDGQIAITHTSSMQNRVLSSKEPPIRVIVPGRSFRHEATDARHEHTFFQIEGIYVDKGITFGDMLGTLKTFFSAFYEREMDVKFSPDYFPFVEPGGMISLDVSEMGEAFMEISKGTGWLEILGCGMIHPKVLEMANLDPNVYTGFAWGFGLERLIMLKYGIEDIRHFYNGNLKFIRQF
ncbi:MAG: phenylalanine--tRNA ligase subunit alpha [Candidatus Dojkabacteria bacterium]